MPRSLQIRTSNCEYSRGVNIRPSERKWTVLSDDSFLPSFAQAGGTSVRLRPSAADAAPALKKLRRVRLFIGTPCDRFFRDETLSGTSASTPAAEVTSAKERWQP